ncbi:MAG TPA: molybdenum cofactor guanylyltransferase, partial [Thermomonospora sp.]|nr:molybdenum cofactor guanylyltransferase [Thermomonospora sp.]
LPFLRPAHVTELRRAAARHGSGAVLADDRGRPQWLIGCWRTPTLRAALDAYGGASLHGLLDPLEPRLVTLPAGERPPWFDCDTPESLAHARTLTEQPGRPS